MAALRRADIKTSSTRCSTRTAEIWPRKVLVSLKSLLGEAVEREWTADSPPAAVKLKRQTRHEARRNPDQGRNLAPLGHLKPRNQVLIVTAVFTGIASRSCRGLTCQHVERRARAIRGRANRLKEGRPIAVAPNRWLIYS